MRSLNGCGDAASVRSAVNDLCAEFGKVLTMDETPIKAGRKERAAPHRGEMKRGYFWPIYGDRDEIAFPCQHSGSAVVQATLKYRGRAVDRRISGL
jgi:hypothetical protein